MKNQYKWLYSILIVVSFVLFLVAFLLLDHTKLIVPIMIALGIYLFFGSIIKLCKTNRKLKNTVLCALDLLFWLP